MININLNIALWVLFFMLTGCGGPLALLDGAKAESVVMHPPLEQTQYAAYVPLSYIVVFRAETGQEQAAFQSYFSEYKYYFNGLALGQLNRTGIKDIQFISSIDIAKPDTKEKANTLHFPRAMRLLWDKNEQKSLLGAINRVDFNSREDAEKILAEWEASGKIWFAEPNWKSQVNGLFDDYATSYEGSGNYWIDNIKAAEGYKYIASQITAGALSESQLIAQAPVIAIMDSGVDYEHPALKNRLWTTENSGSSDCQNDLHGCDTTFNSRGWLGRGTSIHPVGLEGAGEDCSSLAENRSLFGNCRHGTHVAGIAAGSPDEGVFGICPICEIMIIKIVNVDAESPGGSIPDSAILKGLKYVTRFTRNGSNIVRVINSSFGKFQRSRAVSLLVTQLYSLRSGTLVVGAAGNEDTNLRQYPAALEDAVAVSSVEKSLKKASYSNFGSWVDVAAPGGGSEGGIVSSVPGGGTDSEKGTSMAAPVVAGTAAMLAAIEPSLTAKEIRSRIIKSADPSIYDSDVDNGTNAEYYYPSIEGEGLRVPLLGSGQVNLHAALNDENQGIDATGALNLRVAPGCSTIQGHISSKWAYWFMIVFLCFPLFIVRRKW